MGTEARVVQQQMQQWKEEMDLQRMELFRGLVRLNLPPQLAQQIADRVAQRNAMGGIAEAGRAAPNVPPHAPVGPNQERGPEEQRAFDQFLASNPTFSTPAAQAHLWSAPESEPARKYLLEARARDAEARQRQQPPPVPGEVKEREEKHFAENRGIDQNRNQNQGYPEPPNRLAEMPEEIHRAADLTKAGVGNMRHYLNRAENISREGAQEFPQRRADYMNPYIQDVVDKIREEGLRTLNEGVLPSLEAQFIRRGAHGGSKHAGLAQRMARDVQSDILARQTRARHEGYAQAGQLFGNDQLRKLQHGQDVRNIGSLNQGSNLADIASMMDVGRYKQAHAQHGKENEYYNFMRKKYEPFELLEREGALAAGQPVPMSQVGINSVQPNPQLGLNSAGRIGSGAGQILGMTMGVKGGGPILKRRKRRRKR